MRPPVLERLMVRGSQVALKHVIHDIETRTLVIELRRRSIKRWVPCGDMDRRLKIAHSAKVECGIRTTPEECLYDSGLIGLQYRASSYIIVRYGAVRCGAVRCGSVQCGTVLYCTVLYCTVQYSTVQYSTVQPFPVKNGDV